MTALGHALRTAKGHWALVSSALFEEFRFWEYHFPELNGIPMRPLPLLGLLISATDFRCDACLVGYGIFFCGDSYYGVWTEDELACFASFRGPNGEEAPIIALMELYTQVRAKLLLAHAMAGCTVDQGCDNQNVCAWVNAGKPKLRAASGMCKTLFWIGRYFQCPLRRLVYVPTKENCIADALSRFLKEASARDDWLRAVKEWGRLNPAYTTSLEPVLLPPLLRDDGGPCLLIDERDRAHLMPTIE